MLFNVWLKTVLVSSGCCNNVPETEWPQTTEINYLTVLESRNLKSSCQQGHALSKALEKNSSFPLPTLGFQQSLAFPGLYHSRFHLHLHMAVFLLGVSVPKFSPPFSDTNHCIKAHPNLVWSHLNLIISAKILLVNKVMFIDTGGEDLNIFLGWGHKFKPKQKPWVFSGLRDITIMYICLFIAFYVSWPLYLFI